jgi:HAE1 family hydrophobic/amphiphilic exporter-1
VRKQPGVNTVEVADCVKDIICSLRPSMPPGVSLGKVAEDTTMVRDSIAEVDWTLVLTVFLVIFAFRGTASATLIASATIPVSILGITLPMGFVVDDAIVMIVNIVRHREMGKSKLQAALDGANEVG